MTSNSSALPLSISFYTFLIFSIVQLVFSVVANSNALMEDSIAMLIDSVGYGWNYWDEKRGKKDGFAPVFSLITLTILTIYALIISIYSLLTLPATTPDVNTTMMMSFAGSNLAIDFVNLLFYLVDANKIERKCCGSKGGLRYEDDLAEGNEDEGDNSIESTSNLSYVGIFPGSERVKDVNTFSALIHVFADTLRSIAVFVSALISAAANVRGDVCDNSAGIVVGVTIGATCAVLYKEVRDARSRQKDGRCILPGGDVIEDGEFFEDYWKNEEEPQVDRKSVV